MEDEYKVFINNKGEYGHLEVNGGYVSVGTTQQPTLFNKNITLEILQETFNYKEYLDYCSGDAFDWEQHVPLDWELVTVTLTITQICK